MSEQLPEVANTMNKFLRVLDESYNYFPQQSIAARTKQVQDSSARRRERTTHESGCRSRTSVMRWPCKQNSSLYFFTRKCTNNERQWGCGSNIATEEEVDFSSSSFRDKRALWVIEPEALLL